MDTATLSLVGLTVLATSTLSGVFGMAGGLLLMSVLATLLPVPEAMVLHGATQLVANGVRALLLARHVVPRIAGAYTAGAATGIAACWAIGVTVDRASLFVALGTVSLLGAFLRLPTHVTVERPLVAVVCGVIVTAAQIVAGVSGPLLDVFFVKSSLDRRAVIGTKGVTQCVGHAAKLLWFAPLLEASEPGAGARPSLPAVVFVVSALAAIAGTALGRRLLGRMADRSFRIWSTRLVVVLSLLLLVRGALGLAEHG